MPDLGDYPIVRERLEQLRLKRGPQFRWRVLSWGVAEPDVEKVVDRKYSLVVGRRLRGELRKLLLGWDAAPDPMALDEMLVALAEAPRLEDYPRVLRVLEWVYTTRLELFRALARSWRVQSLDIDVPINDTYLKLRAFEPRAELRLLLENWADTERNEERLSDHLSALFVHFLHLRCLDLRRMQAHVLPTPMIEQQVLPDELPAILGALDKHVDEMREHNIISEREWTFWKWWRQNADTPQQEFDRHVTPAAISMMRKHMLVKVLARLRTVPNRQAGGRKNSGANPLTKGRE